MRSEASGNPLEGRGFPLRTVLAALVGIYLLALVTGYGLRGPGPLFDAGTLLLATAFGALLIMLLWTSGVAVFPLVAVLIFTCLIFALPRIQQYLWLPGLVSWPFGDGVTSSEVNQGLMALVVGTGAMAVGAHSTARMWRGAGSDATPHSQAPPQTYGVPAVILVFALVLAVESYITIVMGIGVFGKLRAEVGNTFIQLAKVLVAVDMALFTGIIALLVGRNPRKYLWAGLLIIVYVAYVTYSGGRVGGLRVLTMLFTYLVTARGDFRVRLPEHLAVVVLLGVLTIATYPLGTAARNQLVASRFERLLETPEVRSPLGLPTEIVQAAEAVRRAEDTELYSRPVRFAGAILDRMGALDYLILVLGEPADPAEKARYLSFGYAAKSSINTLVPGALFPEEELSTSRVHSIIYRGIKGITHLSGYNSEYWTLWGLAYLLFGWTGGLLALVAAGALFQAAYLGVMRFSGGYRVYLGAWFLFMTYLYYLSMGVDHSVTVSVITLLQLVTVLAGYHAAETVLRSVRRPVPASP